MIQKQIAIPQAIAKFVKSDRDPGSRSRLNRALYEYFHGRGINRVTSNAWAASCERRIVKRWAREEVAKGYNPAELEVINGLVNTAGGRAVIRRTEWSPDAIHSLANRGIIILIGEDEEREAALIVDPAAD